MFVAAVMGAAPLFALLLLALSGAVAPGPALLAMAGVAAVAFGFALLWTRDLARVASDLRRAAGGPVHGPPDPAPPRSPASAGAAPAGSALARSALAGLAEEAGRIVREQADRAAAAEERLRAERAIVEKLPEPLVILGADLRVHRANAAARRDLGAEAAAALRHPTLRAAVDRALAEGAPQTAELSLPVPVPREVRATVTPLDPAPAGEDGGAVMVLLADRTRERAVERMRADFVANASHELRTPLASLIGFIDTLRGPAADDPQAQRRFLGIMAEQAARMHRLIDGLLGLSRVELTEHQKPVDRVDLAELAGRVAAGFEPALLAREVALSVEIAPALPPIAGDADQLAQVLQNLLDNALKHGGEGVRVRLGAEVARPGERWPARRGVVLSVADAGPGIAPEHLPRLTERFYRVDAGRSRAAGGTGLGLAIVKHVVNRHRGQLRIESAVGKGTTVSVWLPVA